MSKDEWEHWFNNKPTPRVLKEALDIVNKRSKRSENEKIEVEFQDDVFYRLEAWATKRGIEPGAAIVFLIGDEMANFHEPPKAPFLDPMEFLAKFASGTGMCKCNSCSQKLTHDEIAVNGDTCFKCKPDTRSLEF